MCSFTATASAGVAKHLGSHWPEKWCCRICGVLFRFVGEPTNSATWVAHGFYSGGFHKVMSFLGLLEVDAPRSLRSDGARKRRHWFVNPTRQRGWFAPALGGGSGWKRDLGSLADINSENFFGLPGLLVRKHRCAAGARPLFTQPPDDVGRSV